MKVRGWQDLLSGALFVAIGAAALLVIRKLPVGSPSAMGSGAFPSVLGVCLVAIGLLLVARSFAGAVQSVPSIAWRPLLLVAASIALFSFMVLRIGLFASVGAMVVLAGLASYERPRVRRLLALGFVLAVACVVLFKWMLGLPMPLFLP